MNAPFDVLFVFHFVAVLASSQSLFIRENYHRRVQPELGRNERGDSRHQPSSEEVEAQKSCKRRSE